MKIRIAAAVLGACLLSAAACNEPPPVGPTAAPADRQPVEINEPAAEELQQTSAAAVQDAAGQANYLTGAFVDLTHPFNEQTIYWPTENGFRLETAFAGVTERGYYYAANRFTAAEHGGTHLDAPVHFSQGKQTVDEVPLERLIGAAVVVDVSAQCAADRDYQITVDDLRSWEEQHGRTLAESIVLLNTGFAAHWPDREKYLGTAMTGPEAVAELHFPGLHPEAAQWLAEHRAIRAIGIDTASIDYGQSTHFGSHVTLFGRNIPAFENVAGLDKLPDQGFAVVALPMKIGGGSGAPLRIIALLPSDAAPK